MTISKSNTRPMMELTSRRKWRARAAWLLGCLSVSVLTMTAKGAFAKCVVGEHVDMVDPVVTVIDGPADLVSEQARWANLRFAVLEGPLDISLGETWFELERVP